MVSVVRHPKLLFRAVTWEKDYIGYSDPKESKADIEELVKGQTEAFCAAYLDSNTKIVPKSKRLL